jgi:hypothetical protein
MSEYGHRHLETDEGKPSFEQRAAGMGHEHGGRGHIIGMIICCIPMVLAILWVLFSAR